MKVPGKGFRVQFKHILLPNLIQQWDWVKGFHNINYYSFLSTKGYSEVFTLKNLSMKYFQNQNRAIRAASAKIVESDLGFTSSVYFDNVKLKSLHVTQMSQKPSQYNNKFDCSETNDYNIPQDALNEA